MTDDAQRRALNALRFNWAPTPDDVWRDPPFHVDGLHQSAMDLVMDGFADAEKATDSSPIGVALVGQRGAGKTHLLGAIRRQVQLRGGYFFLVSLLETSAFWRSTALSVLDGLAREHSAGGSQLTVFLRRLVDTIGAPRSCSACSPCQYRSRPHKRSREPRAARSPTSGVWPRVSSTRRSKAPGFRRLQAPLCLTHHPRSPLTEEEVLDRARRRPGTR